MGKTGTGIPLQSLAKEYHLGGDSMLCGISQEHTGWDLDTGRTGPMITVLMEDPKEIVLPVSPVDGACITGDGYNCIRAKIELEELSRKSISDEGDGKRIVFKIPRRREYQHGIQTLFVSMMPPKDVASRLVSDFRLTGIE